MSGYHSYSAEFKVEIAKLMVEQHYTIKQACEASGAGESAVRRWRRQYLAECQGETPDKGNALTAEHREIQALKRELQRLKQERDILKKACAFLVQDNL